MDDNQNNQTQDNLAAAGPAPAETPVEAPAATAEPAPEPATPAEPATEPTTEPAAEPAKTEPAAPKAPMNPKTKKTIITLCIVGGAVIILAVLAIILLPIIFKADYSESYKIAKELNSKIDRLSYNSDCSSVVEYYDSKYTSNTTYNGYIENCLAVTDGLPELVDQLGQTSGIKRDSNLQNGYNGFRAVFDKLAIDTDSLKAKMEVYKTWHAFEIAVYDLDEKATDSAVNTAANILIESGNEDLKTYGSGWLELKLNVVKTYKVYYDANWDSTYSEKKEKYQKAKEALSNYVQDNEPNIKTMAPINMENIDAVSTRFEDLYKAIANLYAKNYNKGSGDCQEFIVTGEVYCPAD